VQGQHLLTCLGASVALSLGTVLLIAVSRVVPRACLRMPVSRRRFRGSQPVSGSMVARLQHQPASSRATATALTAGRLLRASKRVQWRCSRRLPTSARRRTAGGWPSWRRISSRLSR